MRLRCGCRAPLSGGDLALKSRPLRGLRRARGVFRIAYVRSRRHARNGRTRFLHRVYPACISPRTAYTVFGIALRRSRVVAARGGAGGSAPLPRYPAQPPDAPTRYFPVLHGPRSPRRTLAAPGAGRGFNGITRASRGRRSSYRNLCAVHSGRPECPSPGCTARYYKPDSSVPQVGVKHGSKTLVPLGLSLIEKGGRDLSCGNDVQSVHRR
jgi:hypothetical protein